MEIKDKEEEEQLYQLELISQQNMGSDFLLVQSMYHGSL